MKFILFLLAAAILAAAAKVFIFGPAASRKPAGPRPLAEAPGSLRPPGLEPPELDQLNRSARQKRAALLNWL